MEKAYSPVTAVLVHAAWSDASSWGKVIQSLDRLGVHARAVQIPLTGLRHDAAAISRMLERIDGPIVLAGHSYGGAAITAISELPGNVTGLVYIAAMAPDEGETVGALLHRDPPHPDAPAPMADSGGFLWLPLDAFAKAAAPDASAGETLLMGLTQRPISAVCLGEPMGPPAWKKARSWFLIAEKDRMISPVTQRFMAERMGAEIRSLAVDHMPLASAPDTVTDSIMAAVDAAV